jgi:hypothetical protein
MARGEKSAQTGRAAARADLPPSLLESDGRKNNPDTALATQPAICGGAADGNPVDRRCAAGSQLGCQEKTNDDKCSKDAYGARA